MVRMGVYGCTPIFGECPLLYNKGMFVANFWSYDHHTKNQFSIIIQ